MRIILILSLAFLIFSCGNSTKNNADNPLLKEAAEYHMEALEHEKNFKIMAKELTSQAASIEIQGKELSEEEKQWLETYHGIMRGYELWSENHIEVPGHEHEHDHSHEGHEHHHHHHHHGNEVQLTPQDMMETQKAFLDNIKDLETKASAFLKK